MTLKELHHLVHYNPHTGKMVWNNPLPHSRPKSGELVGGINNDGYRSVMIKQKLYLVHRLVFLYMTGQVPHFVDHIDRERTNNKWENLRPATSMSNAKNHTKRSNNKSGVTGVCWDNTNKKWMASIYDNRKPIFLGHFSDFFEAVCVRRSAETKYNYSRGNGT
jgi:hypothetical protein